MTRQNKANKNITKYKNGYYTIKHYDITKEKKSIATRKWTRLLTQHNNDGIIFYVLQIIITISQRKGYHFDLSI